MRRERRHSLICARLLTVRLIWSMFTDSRCPGRDRSEAPGPWRSCW